MLDAETYILSQFSLLIYRTINMKWKIVKKCQIKMFVLHIINHALKIMKFVSEAIQQ